MLIKEKIEILKKEIKQLEKLNGNEEYSYKLNAIREAPVKIPSLETISALSKGKINKIVFYFALQRSTLNGLIANISICLDNGTLNLLYINDYENINEPLVKFLKSKYWIDDIFWNSFIDEDKFIKDLWEEGYISSKFLLSLLSDENKEYIRKNNILLDLGESDKSCTLNQLIYYAKNDEFLEVFDSWD